MTLKNKKKRLRENTKISIWPLTFDYYHEHEFIKVLDVGRLRSGITEPASWMPITDKFDYASRQIRLRLTERNLSLTNWLIKIEIRFRTNRDSS